MNQFRESQGLFFGTGAAAVLAILAALYAYPPRDSQVVSRLAFVGVLALLFAALAVVSAFLPRTPFYRKQIENIAGRFITEQLVEFARSEARVAIAQFPALVAKAASEECRRVAELMPHVAGMDASGDLKKRIEQAKREIARFVDDKMSDFEQRQGAAMEEALKTRLASIVQASLFRSAGVIESELRVAQVERESAQLKVDELKKQQPTEGHAAEAIERELRLARAVRDGVVSKIDALNMELYWLCSPNRNPMRPPTVIMDELAATRRMRESVRNSSREVFEELDLKVQRLKRELEQFRATV